MSNYGKVKSFKNTNSIILKNNDSETYNTVLLYTVEGKEYRCSNHILVAELFVKGKSEINNIVNHIDENKRNNHANNLEWTTYKGNSEHSFAKSVVMIDIKSGKDIKTFTSIANAGEYLGKKSGSISACCNGKRKTAFGYKWKFLEE